MFSKIRETVDAGFNDMLAEIYKANGVESGDIAPDQLDEWEILVDQVASLFTTLTEQNLGIDA
jgi:hypothetical protein